MDICDALMVNAKTMTDASLALARILVARVAARCQAFTSDDLRDEIDRKGLPINPLSIGAALAEAKSGENPIIVQIGELPSRRASNHSRKVDVYMLRNGVTGKPLSSSGSVSSRSDPVSAKPLTLSEQTVLGSPVGDATD